MRKPVRGPIPGFAGAFEYTGIPCPQCAEEGRKTNGGYTPRLVKKLAVEKHELYCMGTHGLVFKSPAIITRTRLS